MHSILPHATSTVPAYDPQGHNTGINWSCERRNAGGLLSRWAFPSELAEQYNGAEEWAYRRLQAVSLEGNLFETARVSKVDVGLPNDLDWVRPDIMESWYSLSREDSTAQVHPYKFTMFMLQRTQESGAVNLVQGKVFKLNYSAKIINPSSYILKGDKIVVTVGPWTSHLLPTCPVSGFLAHSITITPSRPVSAYALVTEIMLAKGKHISPEIYARKEKADICGEGVKVVQVPDTADDVELC
ncbi:hypothetical protein V1523DRAFT_465141 [Lipomyces doorenjongii]